MNKAELTEAIASAAKLSKADAKRALDAFVDTTSKALKKGDRVALVGFGSFSVTKRSARKGRNPQTGKEIKIAAKAAAGAGAGDKLFGSVTTQNISDSLKEKGFEVDRKKIIKSEHIKKLGNYLQFFQCFDVTTIFEIDIKEITKTMERIKKINIR